MARSSIDPLELIGKVSLESAETHGDNPKAISKDVIAKLNELPDAERGSVEKAIDRLVQSKD